MAKSPVAIADRVNAPFFPIVHVRLDYEIILVGLWHAAVAPCLRLVGNLYDPLNIRFFLTFIYF